MYGNKIKRINKTAIADMNVMIISNKLEILSLPLTVFKEKLWLSNLQYYEL